MAKTNLLSAIPASSHETFETLFQSPQVKIERIVSNGQASPEGFWYDQAWDEWLLLLQGSAGLLLEGCCEPTLLSAGDCLLIPAGVKHQVAWTDAGGATVWLAVHIGIGDEPNS